MTFEDTILSYLITGTLGIVLTIVGTKITAEDIKTTILTKKKQLILIWGHHYIISPLLAIAIKECFNLGLARTIGLFIFSVSPSSVAASVVTFLVKGDVPLALSGSVINMLSSFLLMPGVFWLQTKIVQLHETNDGLKLPYLQMTSILLFFIVANGVGMRIRHVYEDATVKKYNYICKRIVLFLIIVTLTFFFLSKDLMKNIFYSGEEWVNHYFSLASFIMINPCLTIISTRLFKINEIKERDAIFLTVFRKNPAIPLSVAALSFKGTLSNTEYYIVFGMEFISGMIMDFLGHPLIIILRKLRLGYYCCKDKSAETIVEDIEN
tara:strand:- start:6149 stop:7117 length:969 start_codon:yes stop_codon:yes gene_type:complete